MDELKKLEDAIIASASGANVVTETKVETPVTEVKPETESVQEQDPLKAELERVKSLPQGKTQLEKALHRRKFLDEEIVKLGGKLPEEKVEETEEDAPLTRKDLEEALKDLKDKPQHLVRTIDDYLKDEPNEIKKELINFHIENSIKSTGNPEQDYNLAKILAEEPIRRQITEELARKGTPKTHSSASSAPGSSGSQPIISFTKEEQLFLDTGVITREDILAARAKTQGK